MTKKIKTPQVEALPGMTPLGFPDLPDFLNRKKHPELSRVNEPVRVPPPVVLRPVVPVAEASGRQRVYLANRLDKMPRSVGCGYQNVENVRIGKKWVRFKFCGAWRGMKVSLETWNRLAGVKPKEAN